MRIRWTGHAARTKEWTNADSDVVVLFETKPPPLSPVCRQMACCTENDNEPYKEPFLYQF